MKVMDVFQSLSNTPGWASCSRFTRMAAARYYAGVDRVEDLRAMATPQPIMTNKYTGEDYCLKPSLTNEQVDEIIRLR